MPKRSDWFYSIFSFENSRCLLVFENVLSIACLVVFQVSLSETVTI